ncbi:MAG: sugar phosphate nucleotidyltransferase [Thermodesulfobacteriota bacterium]
MKALVLAAGYGNRLRPHTLHTPKPLFPIAGRPLLERILMSLEDAGCDGAVVNTHHLAHRITDFLKSRTFRMPVHSIHEPEILGTAGAIRNAASFLDDRPFFVVNADIFTDIDLRTVYKAHLASGSLATMVLVDWPEVNTVWVDERGWICGFDRTEDNGAKWDGPKMTFSGIQVLDPKVLTWIPSGYQESVPLYRRLIEMGEPPRAFIAPKTNIWCDIGSVDRYRQVAREQLAQEAFLSCDASGQPSSIRWKTLPGDGSDRSWYRLQSGGRSLVLVDHGIRESGPRCTEAESWLHIAAHLMRHGLPVPQPVSADTFSGIVVMKDVGDCHFQNAVQSAGTVSRRKNWYERLMTPLTRMGLLAVDGFDPDWCWETTHYDERLILEKECGYFRSAFLEGWLEMKALPDGLEGEFSSLAARTLDHAVSGLVHRDMQSRNVMVQEGDLFFIDFQGARIGPVQYDLASLAVDPYVPLASDERDALPALYRKAAEHLRPIDGDRFEKGFRLCCITRNLQILGAFAFLSRVKGKRRFEAFIPDAIATLERNLNRYFERDFPILIQVVASAREAVRRRVPGDMEA